LVLVIVWKGWLVVLLLGVYDGVESQVGGRQLAAGRGTPGPVRTDSSASVEQQPQTSAAADFKAGA
jgi:hypothetical protein